MDQNIMSAGIGRTIEEMGEPECMMAIREGLNQQLDQVGRTFIIESMIGIDRGIRELDEGLGVSLEEAKRAWGIT